jgi:23S rRNA (cytidine1920-2'-O)/16S rRNA (cytidine1409-2'-O)-methyltransferase
MVKPQFEVGKDGSGGGVVATRCWAEAVTEWRRAAGRASAWPGDPQPLPGPAGNVEFFLWLRRDARRLTRS